MENAASTSKRKEMRARRMAQKIIISHIRNYLGSVLWGVNLIEDYRYHPMPLPTYRDYETLISTIKNDELFFPENPDCGRVLVGIQNIYFVRKNGELYEERRPEDIEKEDVPKVAYLVVNENIFRNENKKRFKCRNMKKLLQDIRALALLKLVKLDDKGKEKKDKIGPMLMGEFNTKEIKSYKDYLRDLGYSKEKINQLTRKNARLDYKMNRMSKDLTFKDSIRKEFFKNRKTFNKKLERLKKVGLAL
ncbi:MAG: hypothetical protein ABH951_01580 [Patescibacteria group bacterium]